MRLLQRTTRRMRLTPALSAFALEYPEIEVQLHLTERPIHLVEQGFDAMISFGDPPDSRLIVSLFTQLAGPDVAMAAQLAQGLFIAVAHVLWFALVAWFFSAPALQPRAQAMRPWIDKSLGGVLMGLGLLLIGTAVPQ